MRPVQSYTSKSGKHSGVSAYQTGKDFIKVCFAGNNWYTYSYQTAGKEVIEKMKKLAASNEGLSTYISQYQPGYER